MKEQKKRKNILDVLTYAYIRRIKKWMFCPACQNGKMSIDKKSTMWTCEDCNYKLSADEFEDDYIFWFCDDCNTYLNAQEGFDRNASKHICRKCGFENDTTFENLRGICVDCGKILPDPDATLCVDCKLERHKIAKKRFTDTGKFIGAVAVVAGATYVTTQARNNIEDNNQYSPLSIDCDEDMFDYVTESWLETASEDELRSTAQKMESLLDELDYDSEEHTNISNIHIDVVNAIASRFPLNLPKRENGWYLPNDD